MIARSGWTLVGLLLALAGCSAGQPVASVQTSPSTFASSLSSVDERPEPFGPDDQQYFFGASVTSFGPDWIATLGQPDGAPTAVRFSANGLDWVATGGIDAGPSLAVERATLEETTIGLLFAPGSHMWIEGAPGAWISPDAVSWSAIELPPSAWAVDAVESQGLVVLSGTIPGPAGSSTSAIWVRATE